MTAYRRKADPTLINAIAAGKTIIAAAAEAGICRRTAYTRLQDPEIQRQVDERRQNLTEIALDNICHTAEPASKQLDDLVRNAQSESVRLSAIKTALAHTFTIRDNNKLRDRIRELEALVDALLDQAPQSNDLERYWPSDPQKTPCVVGLDLQHGYRHISNWMEYQLYKGGLSDEKKLEFLREIPRLRDEANGYDEAIAS